MNARSGKRAGLAALLLAAVAAAGWFSAGRRPATSTADRLEAAAPAAVAAEAGERRVDQIPVADARPEPAAQPRDEAIAITPAGTIDERALEDARSVERELLSDLPEVRARLMAAMKDEDFAALMHAFEVQMQHDVGALELTRLFADHARGELPANGAVRLLDLRCGVRLCAAALETSSPDRQLPRLGYSSLGVGTPLGNGGMSHRVIFTIDRDLLLLPPRAPPKHDALALQASPPRTVRTKEM